MDVHAVEHHFLNLKGVIKIFIKYPKIKILGDRSNEGILTTPGKVVIQEKVDGANFGFYVKGDVLYFCSHNQNLTDSEQIAKTGIPKTWRSIEPVLESFQNDPLEFNGDFYYYGESLQKHTISYDDIPGFIGYDILDLRYDEFLDWEFVKQIFTNLGLPFINTYCELLIKDDFKGVEFYNKISTKREISIDYLKSIYQKSAYRDGNAEGIVIKRYDTQLMAKIVDDSFKEKVKQPKLKIDTSNEQGIVNMYATPARIEKIIYKLHDTGYEIEMAMMKVLFKEVVKDILEEEIINIYIEYKSINFKSLNTLVSKKCSITLKQIIMNNRNI